MKKSMFKIASIAVLLLFASSTFAQKIQSKKTQISFYSHTAIEDIKSSNVASVSTLDKTTGDVVFSVPMQSFSFEKSLMQKHFNSDNFLDTKKEPKAKLVAKITNINAVNFAKDGTYTADVAGDMTIKGTTKPFKTKATIVVKAGAIDVNSEFDITLADYGIAFSKGKPSTNIAKTIKVNIIAQY